MLLIKTFVLQIGSYVYMSKTIPYKYMFVWNCLTHVYITPNTWYLILNGHFSCSVPYSLGEKFGNVNSYAGTNMVKNNCSGKDNRGENIFFFEKTEFYNNDRRNRNFCMWYVPCGMYKMVCGIYYVFSYNRYYL